MYTKDKEDIKLTLEVLQDYLNDAWRWDAENDDVLNEELDIIQKTIDELNEKIKTI